MNTKKDLFCAVYEKDATNNQKWFEKFQAGDFFLNKVP